VTERKSKARRQKPRGKTWTRERETRGGTMSERQWQDAEWRAEDEEPRPEESEERGVLSYRRPKTWNQKQGTMNLKPRTSAEGGVMNDGRPRTMNQALGTRDCHGTRSSASARIGRPELRDRGLLSHSVDLAASKEPVPGTWFLHQGWPGGASPVGLASRTAACRLDTR